MSAARPPAATPAAAAPAPAAAPAAPAAADVAVASPSAPAAAVAPAVAAPPTIRSRVASTYAPKGAVDSVWRSPVEPLLLSLTVQTLLHTGEKTFDRGLAAYKKPLPRGKWIVGSVAKRAFKVVKPTLPPVRPVMSTAFYFTTYECFREDMLSGPGFFSRFAAGFLAGSMGYGMTLVLPERLERARWNMRAPKLEAAAAAELAKKKAELVDISKLSKKARAVAMSKLESQAAAAANTFAHTAPQLTPYPLYGALYTGIHRSFYFALYGKFTGEMSVQPVRQAPAHKFEAAPAGASALDAALAEADAAPAEGDSLFVSGARLVQRSVSAVVASGFSGLLLHANEQIRERTLASQSLPPAQRFASTFQAAKYLLRNELPSVFAGVRTAQFGTNVVQGALMLLAFDYGKRFYLSSQWAKNA